MELAGQGGTNNYRQLADEISAVLQSAAETAERMLEEGRAEATRLAEEAEAERRLACAEGRRIIDEARMEADMMGAEAEWQAQEIIAQAKRAAAERVAGADARLAEVERAETRVLDRLAGVGQVLADSLAALREGAADTAAAAAAAAAASAPTTVEAGPADETPSAKVYFVEFPPATAEP
ncbi:MAG TPA: hypothetical protein VHL53_05935, partial [Acidimicrobiia bacterium]|nr:hypothetical protein [Acidimicrobiia bacterium]